MIFVCFFVKVFQCVKCLWTFLDFIKNNQRFARDDFFTDNHRKEKQQRIYKYIADCGLIILDDMMYAPIPPEDLPMLYRAITFLNETRSFIVITNRDLSGWTDAAEDTHLMQTIVDRLTSNSQILRFL